MHLELKEKSLIQGRRGLGSGEEPAMYNFIRWITSCELVGKRRDVKATEMQVQLRDSSRRTKLLNAGLEPRPVTGPEARR